MHSALPTESVTPLVWGWAMGWATEIACYSPTFGLLRSPGHSAIAVVDPFVVGPSAAGLCFVADSCRPAFDRSSGPSAGKAKAKAKGKGAKAKAMVSAVFVPASSSAPRFSF